MGTLKVSILEKDGVDYDYPIEMDLLEALNFIGFTGSGFDENLLLVNENFTVICDHLGNVLKGV